MFNIVARDCANICALLLDGTESENSQILAHVFIETLTHVNALVPTSMRIPLNLWKDPKELRIRALKLWVFIRNSDFLLATINGLAGTLSVLYTPIYTRTSVDFAVSVGAGRRIQA